MRWRTAAWTHLARGTLRRLGLLRLPRSDAHDDTFTLVKVSTQLVANNDDIGTCEAERVEGGQLERVQAALSEAAALDLAETFRLLSDPGRVRLIAALLEADELCVCDLSDATGLSQTACSHNLRLLRAQRLVRYRRQGRNVYYTLDDDHIRVLLEVALQHVTHG